MVEQFFDTAPFAHAFDDAMAMDVLKSQQEETSAGIGPRLYVGHENDVLVCAFSREGGFVDEPTGGASVC